MDVLKFFGALLLFFVVIFGLVIALACWTESNTCEAVGAKMGVEHSWGFWTDCQIKVGGKWIPLSAYRVVGVQE